MSRQYLHTELRSELEAVELAWDVFLNNVDETLVEPLISFMSRTAEDWVLVGQRHFVDRLVQFSRGTVEFSCIVVESSRAIREAQIDELVQHTHRVIGSNTHIFLCVSDRYDACRIAAGLPQTCSIHTLDLLKELVGERLPAAVWRAKFDHIYPIKIPEVRIRKHLDVLLLDMPARSLAQLPIGFAYVYKALRQTGLHLQAIDVDLIAYHRYHSRRCLNYIDRILHEGMLHPQDPWQAENYIVWTDKKFIDYFSDILDEVVEKVVEANPKIVAFSLHQTSHVSIEKVVARLRAALPEVRIVVGGMSCYQHFVARRIFPQADYVVVGEADTVIAPLMEALARGERPADVPGVVSRYDSADRTFIAAPLPHNLDIIGGPDYGLTNLDLYVGIA